MIFLFISIYDCSFKPLIKRYFTKYYDYLNCPYIEFNDFKYVIFTYMDGINYIILKSQFTRLANIARREQLKGKV